MAYLIGQFSGPGVSAPVPMEGDFNVSLAVGFTAVVQLERQFVNDAAWFPVTYVDGSVIQWSAPLSTVMSEPEQGVVYRLRCTSFTSGPVSFRISQ